mgnify:CR=1 FL=1
MKLRKTHVDAHSDPISDTQIGQYFLSESESVEHRTWKQCNLRGQQIDDASCFDLSSDPPACASELLSLNLSLNDLTTTPTFICTPFLHILDLSTNHLSSLSELAPLSRLTKLNVSNNEISSLDGLPSFSSLTHLVLAVLLRLVRSC